MNRQEVFDTILAHLRQQGRAATDEVGDCMYRAPGGLKCAVGVLIPDENYHPELENQSANATIVRDALPFPVTDGDAAFLSEIQRDLHDNLDDLRGDDFRHMLEIRARHIARTNGLEYKA